MINLMCLEAMHNNKKNKINNSKIQKKNGNVIWFLNSLISHK